MLLQILVVSFFNGALLQEVGPSGELDEYVSSLDDFFRQAVPEDPTITKLVDAGLKETYQWANIRRGLHSTRALRQGYTDARKDICDCYYGETPSASTIQFNETDTTKGIQDTCPTVGGVFTFPKSVYYNREQCWVIGPWAGLSCPYNTCRNRSCQGVRPTSPLNFTFCRPTNFKCKVYYIWCPIVFSIYKQYMCLPHYCSCMYMPCKPSDGIVIVG